MPLPKEHIYTTKDIYELPEEQGRFLTEFRSLLMDE